MSFIADAFGLAAPQAAIVTKVVEVAAVLGLAGSVVLYLEHRGAASELHKLEKSSQQVKADAAKQIADNNTAHAKADTDNQEKLNAAHDDVARVSAERDAVAGSFAQWVHQRANSGTNGAVARPGSQPTATSDGECGPLSCAELAIELVQDGDNLARDLGLVSADLYACQRDRDSLTGLPR